MELVIRPGRPEDLDTIVAFNLAMAAESEGRQPDAGALRRGVAAALREPERGRYLVAERGGRVVGQAMLTREWSDWRDGWFWWFQSVYTAPDERRRGVFRAIYRQVEEEARRAGDVRGLRLYVEAENAAGRATYRSLGMREPGYLVCERDWSGSVRGVEPGARDPGHGRVE